MFKLKEVKIIESERELEALPEGKLLINTINAHSYNTALKDPTFAEALKNGDALIPDGASIILACRSLKAKSQPHERIAGWDLFTMEMERLNRKGGKCFFMGSSEKVLKLIREKAQTVYPNIQVETYSPPYKPVFSEEDNQRIIETINQAQSGFIMDWNDRTQTRKMGVYTLEGTEHPLPLRYHWRGIRFLRRHHEASSPIMARSLHGMVVSID